MNVSEAAALLGMKESEVVDVVDSDIGPVIRTKDNQVMVVLEEPDFNGRSGLMYLAAPSKNYGDTFPVYAPADASVVDREAIGEYLESIGAGDLAEAEVVAGPGAADPRDAKLTEADVVETVDALITDAGPQPVEEVPGAPENVPEPGDLADPGTTAPVPEGNIETVLEWVGNDAARARQALDAEAARPTPRSTLVAELTERVGDSVS